MKSSFPLQSVLECKGSDGNKAMDVAYDSDLNQNTESKFDKTSSYPNYLVLSHFLFVFFYLNHNLCSR